MSPDEVFIYPDQMGELMSSTLLGVPKPEAKKVRGTATGKPKPQVPDLPEVKPRTAVPSDSIPADSTVLSPDSLTLPDSVTTLMPDSLALPESEMPVPDEPADAADGNGSGATLPEPQPAVIPNDEEKEQ